MTTNDIKTLLGRQPFRPFSIELISGNTIHVGLNSEVLLPRPRPELVIVFTDDGIQHQFEDNVISRLLDY